MPACFLQATVAGQVGAVTASVTFPYFREVEIL